MPSGTVSVEPSTAARISGSVLATITAWTATQHT
jgi:hypothetical protein